VLARAVDEVLETQAVLAVGNGPIPESWVWLSMFLAHRGRQTATRAARFLGVSKPAVTQIVDAMIQARLISRRAGKRDRREVELQLTPAGRRLSNSIRKKQLQIVRVAMEVSKSRQARAWAKTFREAARALVSADEAFDGFCLQCGAYADDMCVLQGGGATCPLRREECAPEPPRRKARRSKRA